MKEAAKHRLHKEARLGSPRAVPPAWRWVGRTWAGLRSRLTMGMLLPLATEIPAFTTREQSLAAWIDSVSEHTGFNSSDTAPPQSDTSAVHIRPINARDGDLLSEGFARLSARSRQMRFLGTKVSLTPAELDHLTNVDRRHKEALVALSQADGRGVGVARYTRDPHNPKAAEVVVTVIDEWHRRGVGSELITKLIARARDKDIHTFTALVANDNLASINLIHSLDLEISVRERDHQTTEYEIALTEPASVRRTR